MSTLYNPQQKTVILYQTKGSKSLLCLKKKYTQVSSI